MYAGMTFLGVMVADITGAWEPYTLSVWHIQHNQLSYLQAHWAHFMCSFVAFLQVCTVAVILITRGHLYQINIYCSGNACIWPSQKSRISICHYSQTFCPAYRGASSCVCIVKHYGDIDTCVQVIMDILSNGSMA